MILITVFTIFCAIFGFLYQSCSVLEYPYIADLVRSFGAYARLHGKLPQSTKNTIPWTKIGISATFFHQTSTQNLQYQPEMEYMSENLISVDCVHWIADNIRFTNKNKKQYGDIGKTNICLLEEKAFTLQNKIITMTISNDELIEYMCYKSEHHKIDYKKITTTTGKPYPPPRENLPYPTNEAKVLGFFM